MNSIQAGQDDRFIGIARLYGREGLRRLQCAHVCVVGLGGVGSWTVEALARSGIGALTLVDLDDVCVSNVNRQLHALNGTIGQSKAEVLADRARAINPGCRVVACVEFFTPESAQSILSERFDFLCDAIDTVSNKCLLIARCHEQGIPLVTCGGAGGRRDPTAIRAADLADTSHDRLLQKVREQLRREHGFPRGGKKLGVPCVFSTEPQVFPDRESGRNDASTSRRSALNPEPAQQPGHDAPSCPAFDANAQAAPANSHSSGSTHEPRENLAPDSSSAPRRLNCEWGFGSASFVTGAFGFAAAGVIVQAIAGGLPRQG